MTTDEYLADNISISVEVFQFFASYPYILFSEVPRVRKSKDHPLYDALNRVAASIDRDLLKHAYQDRKFMDFWGEPEGGELEFHARCWIIERALTWKIPATRICCLRNVNQDSSPAPLSHKALADLEIPSDGLLPLSEFMMTGSHLVRNGVAFTALSTVESANSQYWYLNALYSGRIQKSASVRLDPLLVRPASECRSLMYKMWAYGRSLDWSRLRNLKEEEHGRWQPNEFQRGVEFTDFCWSPRDGEVHFKCEEVPERERLRIRGSRYLHAIYKPNIDQIVHLDGAVRLYDECDWQERREVHVRKIGKIGERHKVFKVEKPLTTDEFSNLCIHYYVWNSDVQRYFGADIPEDL